MNDDSAFISFSDSFLDFYSRGNYHAALDLLHREGGRFPFRAGVISIWVACIMARLGDTGHALQTLKKALSEGHVYKDTILRDDPDLASLQGVPEFQELMGENNRRYQEVAASSRPLLTVFEPKDAPQPWPALIALHANMSSADRDAEHWKAAAEWGWLVAAPQSSQLGWLNGTYVWDDPEKTRQELVQHLELLEKQYPLDLRRLVLGGFSKGAQAAARTAICGELPASGFIALEGWKQDDDMPGWERRIQMATNTGLRAALIDGSRNEPYVAGSDQISALLEERGIPLARIQLPGSSHVVPKEFKAVLKSALDFVCPLPSA